MIITRRWHFSIDEDTAAFWVRDVLPLTIAHATVGRPFHEIVDFTSSMIAVDSLTVIVGAESEPTGTTFKLSMA